MPRKRILTWQPGADGRSGRWRKQYRGQTHYLGVASSQSDQAGYDQALANWQKLKSEIDDQQGLLPKPYQAAYEEAIADWEKLLAWAQNHGDSDTAERAREQLYTLRKQLELKSPPALEHGDRFWDRFSIPSEILARLSNLLNWPNPTEATNAEMQEDPRVSPKRIIPTAQFPGPKEMEKRLWQDRLAQTAKQQENVTQRIGPCLERYLDLELLRVQSGNLSTGRYTSKRNNLNRFKDYVGETTPVGSINGVFVQDYHTYLLKQIGSETLAPDTARDRMNDTIAFIRWMWQLEILPELPRLLIHKSQSLAISKRITTPSVFTVDEIKTLLAKAEDRTKLFILLMLNIGAYQSDISELRQEEVDWAKGTITRKRTKTRTHKNVPTVTYRLWPETLTLMKQFRSKSGDRVLSNTLGNPLVDRGVKPDGRAYTNDSIKNAFDRLRTKSGIKKPMKLLRKTSATLIRSQAEFRGLEDLFLGHAPSTMSDRHYAQPPEDLLAAATDWLGTVYGID